MNNLDFRFKIERGWHSTVIIFPALRIVLKVFNKGLIKNAEKEFYFLKMLYNKGFNVPKPYVLINDKERPILIREFINGLHFNEFLSFASLESIRTVVLRLIKLAYKLDLEKIFIDELSKVTRNILVTDDLYPYIIDFERATVSNRSNVLQFLSYLYRLSLSKASFADKIKEIIDIKRAIEIGSLYKKKKDFNLILECLKM